MCAGSWAWQSHRSGHCEGRRPEHGLGGGLQFDSTTDGRPVKIASIIDELDRLADQRGYPAVLRCDNGPELACQAMADWAAERTGLAFIPPGEPWRNDYVESFNSRVPRRMPQHQPLLVTHARPRRQGASRRRQVE